MPPKNTVKIYLENGIYHVYNRGVEKRTIFIDDHDYKVFLSFLKESLSPPPDLKTLIKSTSFKSQAFKGIPRLPKNFYEQAELLAYCLMPNHFHLLIKQKTKDVMKEFIQSIATRYTLYFNKTHKRVGSLFQGRYKAVLVSEDSYLLHLSRYIHRNPLEFTSNLANAYSSYGEYLGVRKTDWINPKLILSYFQPGNLPFLKHVASYKNFVEETSINSEEELGSLTLEDTL